MDKSSDQKITAKEEVLSNSHHHKRLSLQMAMAMESADYTDVNFVLEGQTVACHRHLLASSCRYFHDLFQEQFKNRQDIPISNMSLDCFKSIKGYIYTGEIKVDIEKSFDVLQASIDIGHNCLQRDVLDYMLRNNKAVLTCEKYLTMSSDAIALSDKDLPISSEEIICSHLLKWLEYSSDKKVKVINETLLSLRLESLSPEYIEYTLLTNPCVMRNEDAVEKLRQVLRHIMFNDVVPPFLKSQLPRTQTTVCNGLAVISISNNRNVLSFGLNQDGKMQKVKERSINADYVKDPNTHTQACSVGHMIYIVAYDPHYFSNKFNFVRTDLISSDCSQHTDIAKKSLLISGRKNQLLLIHGCTILRYIAQFHTWQNVFQNGSFWVEKPGQAGQVKWYLTGTNSSSSKLPSDTITYGGMLDEDKVFIFGARPYTEMPGVVNAAVNILQISTTKGTVHTLDITLPEHVESMEVVPYKDHVILIGSNTTLIIRLEELHKSQIVNTDMATMEDKAEQSNGEKSGELGIEAAQAPDRKVLVSKLKPLRSLKTEISQMKICRMCHQIICFMKAQTWSIWSVDIEDIILNSDNIQWKQIDALSGEQQKVLDSYTNLVVVPTKIRK